MRSSGSKQRSSPSGVISYNPNAAPSRMLRFSHTMAFRVAGVVHEVTGSVSYSPSKWNTRSSTGNRMRDASISVVVGTSRRGPSTAVFTMRPIANLAYSPIPPSSILCDSMCDSRYGSNSLDGANAPATMPISCHPLRHETGSGFPVVCLMSWQYTSSRNSCDRGRHVCISLPACPTSSFPELRSPINPVMFLKHCTAIDSKSFVGIFSSGFLITSSFHARIFSTVVLPPNMPLRFRLK